MKRFFLLMTLIYANSSYSKNQEPPSSAASCIACHGGKGISVNPLWPNLAGQKAAYLSKQLLDFKENRRVDPIMGPLAKTLTDEEIQQLSNYFSSL